MRKHVIRSLFVIVGAAIGFYYLPLLWKAINFKLNGASLVFIDLLIGALIFWLLSYLLATSAERLVNRTEAYLSKQSPIYLLFGSLLTIVGLVLAVLLSIPLWNSHVPVIDNVVPIILMLIFGYMGFRLGTTRVDDWRKLFQFRRQNKDGQQEVASDGSLIKKQDKNYHHYKILDTNILIDGRIYDIVKTGFIEGTLLVPNFVLYELQYIADSSDSIKRVRGRRGLDILNKLQSEDIIPIEMYEGDFEDVPEVDSKLIRLAKEVDGVIVTNDYNLNKVIQFQNVQVMNINSLTKSLKPRVIPGETLNVMVVKNGTERQQGVAYLDDGTMVVVEDGRYYINDHIDVEVTSALQTDAGRMIFARPLHSTKGINEHRTSEKGNSDSK
ncbi:twitching motility protein PilT [Paucilactobacillus hokkaidonensis JCM 18461]|uniref:Twitching motility protein PilT n=2 Tax=Paucilactobacillus hokkaidonensis TaxID=1193095 RepID=A0A0A1GX24_9LACO|nr:PIN/TRAM domain-containing protein [Paucilactobacillus hokkaidonensis]KRO11433.1 PilT domain-containing protein [Paucilactobacillus hokkaidonensis]BAP85016.1 twitching motility protein PilT [Paucilactobacillus hokkaidonensis JCM 18461]